MGNTRYLGLAAVLLSMGGCSSPTVRVDAFVADDAFSGVDAFAANDAFAGGDAFTGLDAPSAGDASAATDSGQNYCQNTADQAVVAAGNVGTVVGNCARMSFGAEPATRNCIRSMTGLTMACADCYDGEVSCTTMHCLSSCAANPSGAACTSCRAMFCDPAFTACSGMAP